MKHLTINTLGKWLILFLMLSVLITLATSWALVRNVTNLNAAWSDNERSIIQKQAYLSALRGAIGYGGMIHYFKNYLLRQENFYLLNTHRSMLETKIILSGYRVLGVSEEEENALKNIESVIHEYARGIALAEVLTNADYSISLIDKQVIVNDALALRSLLSLADVLATLRQSKTNVVSGKINSLSNIISVTTVWIGIMLLVVIVLLMWFLRYRLIYPLARLTAAIGQIDPRMPGQTRLPGTENKDDELSMVANAVNRFLDSMETHLIERQNAERALEDAKVTADKANKAKSGFLSTMSHELRTPLTSSMGSLGLLNSFLPKDFPEEQRELLEIAIRNSKSLLHLVNELLDYDKFLSGTLVIETSPHDICALTSSTVKNLQGYAQTHCVNFVFNEPTAPIFAAVQEHRFEQILNNLLSNAAKFSSAGDDVVISIIRKDGFVFIDVKDSGTGITEEFKGKIFEQFTQADSSSTRQQGGTGLGLAISKALTGGMGGVLDFETEVGVGSIFFFGFPEITNPSPPTG